MSENDSTEIWKSVPGWANYQVSTLGRVRSVRRLLKGGHVQEHIRILRPSIQRRRRYERVTLTDNYKHYNPLVHRLVLLAFRGPCPSGMEACHLDGNPRNNRLSNLEWNTRLKNAADKIRHMRQRRGEEVANSKLTKEHVIKIYRMIAEGHSSRFIGQKFGISKTSVLRLMHAVAWKHVSDHIFQSL